MVRTYFLDNFIATEINVETDVSRGIYHFSIVGMGDKAINEARERVQAAIKNSDLSLKSRNQRITVLLAPASIKKEGSGFDLVIAVSYLKAIGKVNFGRNFVFIAELSLKGELRAPKNFLYLFREILRNDRGAVIVTAEECRELCQYFIDERVVYCKNLYEVVNLKREERNDSNLKYKNFIESVSRKGSLAHIYGCETGKRAIAIAVAGRHNLLMVGPPGVGKTLLAKSIKEISHPLSKEESFECTAISEAKEPIIFPPFREPHHTSSYNAVISEEIKKAHNGFLFLDEVVEFDRRVIESLREPLESGKITLSKVNKQINIPANFTLIAAMNPCKCGFRGSNYKKCVCRNVDAIKYSQKVSGPMLDRFDMVIHVGVNEGSSANQEDLYLKVKSAVEFSSKRSKIPNGKLKTEIKLTENAKISLEQITKGLNLSKRAIVKITKVARTIADLEQNEEVLPEYLYEAVAYRQEVI